jgi:hypothetical protein
MSLDWSIDGIADWQTVCMTPTKKGQRLSDVTNEIIWNCMFIGIGVIDEKNWLEWWMRYAALDTFGGAVKSPLTAADVRAHIGLRTNVFPKWSKVRFYERLMQAAADHANVPKAEQPVFVMKKRR